MGNIKKKLHKITPSHLQVVGILLVLLLVGLLLWHGNANSWQATNALMAQVRFQGEYRIGDDAW